MACSQIRTTRHQRLEKAARNPNGTRSISSGRAIRTFRPSLASGTDTRWRFPRPKDWRRRTAEEPCWAGAPEKARLLRQELTSDPKAPLPAVNRFVWQLVTVTVPRTQALSMQCWDYHAYRPPPGSLADSGDVSTHPSLIFNWKLFGSMEGPRV